MTPVTGFVMSSSATNPRPQRAYRQRDGKLVTINANGEAKRFLASGDPDPEPLAGLMNLVVRVWNVLGRRLLDDKPLAAEDIAFAHPRAETIAEFNRARADWQRAAFALCEAIKDDGEAMERMRWAAGDSDFDLYLFEFVNDADADSDEARGLLALIVAVNTASGWLGAAVANIAEAGR